jgi:hypothetical protein
MQKRYKNVRNANGKCLFKCKVCKSMHKFQINQPTRCKNVSSLLLEVYSYYISTCFGRPHSHHQEINNCSSSLWFYSWSVVVALLLVVVGPSRPDHNQQHCYHHAPMVDPTTTNSTATTTLQR